jgi:hypothetical protein
VLNVSVTVFVLILTTLWFLGYYAEKGESFFLFFFQSFRGILIIFGSS